MNRRPSEYQSENEPTDRAFSRAPGDVDTKTAGDAADITTPAAGASPPTAAGALPQSAEFRPPCRFGKYELEALIDRGGMAVVYKAFDPDLRRTVALKTMRSELFIDAAAIARFYREARAMAQLKHAHIVSVHEVGQQEGVHYFTMDFAPEGTLASRVAALSHQPRAAVAMVEKVARAVHYAHTKQVLHRDLKPGNILIDEHGEPLVSDFGLAKLDDGGEELTRPGQAMGTIAYMAPEQAGGEISRITAQSDVWSLGVILFELLTGRRPFVGESREHIRQQVLTASAPSLRSLNPALPERLDAIVLKCLQREQSQRCESAAALVADLAAWLSDESLPRSRDALQPMTAPVPLVTRSRQRRVALMVAAIALVLLSVYGVSIIVRQFWPHAGKDSPSPGTADVIPTRPTPDISFDFGKQLASGEHIMLVGDQGVPLHPYAWAISKQEGPRSLSTRDGTFSVATARRDLLELGRVPFGTRYRVRGEIRQLLGERTSAVGVYFWHRHIDTELSRVDFYYELAFNDAVSALDVYNEMRKKRKLVNVPPPQGNPVLLQSALCVEVGGRSADWFGGANYARVFFEAAGSSNPQWRSFAVELAADSIRGYWNGQLAGEITKSQLTENEQAVRARLGATYPLFGKLDYDARPTSSGSFGILVENASASLRNIVVEPLK